MTARTATLVCAAILALYAAVLVLRTAPVQGWPGAGTTVATTSDYVSLWTAGKLAREDRPLAAYHWAEQKPEFERLTGKTLDDKFYLAFPYPPTFLALMALLAALAYGTSHLVWVSATSAAYALAAYRITGERAAVLWLSAPIALLYNADAGQTGALSAALLGLGLVFVPVRPILAGVFFGLLTYKPHLGLLIPLALAAGGHWRTFLSAGLTAVIAALAASLAFGVEAWPAFLAQLSEMGAHIYGAQSPWKLQSVFGAARTLGLPAPAALTLHVAFAVTLAMLVTWTWRRDDVAYETRAAALAASALLMSPYVFIYDMTVLMVAQAFLIRRHLRTPDGARGAVPAIIAANILVLLAPIAAVPTGALATFSVLAAALSGTPLRQHLARLFAAPSQPHSLQAPR